MKRSNVGRTREWACEARTLCVAAVAAIALSISSASVHADANFPSKSITLLVPFSAGGPTDILARLVSTGMSRALGQQVVIENLGGAGGTIAAARAARVEPDGYTIMIHHQGLGLSPALYDKLTYNPATDFKVIGLINRSPMLLVGRKGLQAQNFPDLVSYVNQKGPEIKFGHTGAGGTSNLCALIVSSAFKVAPSYIPYRGGDPALRDVIGEHIDLYCGLYDSFSAINAGSVRGFGVLGNERLETIPHVPTLPEAGFPNLKLDVWFALFAPAKTPGAVVDKLNDALLKTLAQPATKKQFSELGSLMYPPDMLSPAGGMTFYLKEMSEGGAFVKKHNIKPN